MLLKLKDLKNFESTYMIKKHTTYIRNSKQALNHGLVLKQVHRVIKFNEMTWLKPYIDMNAELKKKAKNDFEKFTLMKNTVFGNFEKS